MSITKSKRKIFKPINVKQRIFIFNSIYHPISEGREAFTLDDKKQQMIEIINSIDNPQLINNLYCLVNEYKKYYS